VFSVCNQLINQHVYRAFKYNNSNVFNQVLKQLHIIKLIGTLSDTYAINKIIKLIELSFFYDNNRKLRCSLQSNPDGKPLSCSA
jgi:hypothetical protein